MQIFKTRNELRAFVKEQKSKGRTIGYVPTMGALHEGHLSLVNIARQNADVIVSSIFVNPTQFAPQEDLDTYPRDLEGDAQKLENAGVDALYAPEIIEMYPNGDMSSPIKAGKAAQGLEADFRPTHFDGVVNIVSRLFDHVQPDIAVFGQKDYQQVCVIREMLATLNSDLKIIEAPIKRDEHGLALSSRNAYLSPTQLEIARTLNKTLYQTAEAIEAAPHNSEELLKQASKTLLSNGFDKVDYVKIRNGRILAAVYVGTTRLIDNVAAPASESLPTRAYS